MDATVSARKRGVRVAEQLRLFVISRSSDGSPRPGSRDGCLLAKAVRGARKQTKRKDEKKVMSLLKVMNTDSEDKT